MRIEPAILVEGRSAVRVVGLALLGVREQLVRGLGGGELVFGAGVFVGVGVVFFGEAVVCFFDVGGGGGFGD
jgi:hypothetical protein